ncbi:MAG TPA: amidohydrolase family protein [Stellaceae bacterium]|nr:amidohydrolase family protein [Stellaceae bacterium]
MDLVIRRARLSHAPEAGVVDIGIAAGRIAAIAPALAAEARSFDAGGRLACAGLVETHIHLDKSRIVDRCAPEEGRDVAAVKRIRPLKPGFTVADVRARAERTLERAILNGTTRMRTHVEVDPGVGLRGFEGVQSLIADYRWAIDLEICVFPQEGLTNYPGTDALLVESLKRGARVIGAAPNYDSDHAGQIRRIFELARDFDVDIDMHLDFGNTPEAPDIPLVCALTEQHRLGGRVAVGHMTKLSTLPPARVVEIARRLADTGIAVTVLPATDLFLMGRDQEHDVRRGVVDANLLLEHGVNCSISSNNVLNPATPYGDCSLIRMANLHANVLQVSTRERLRECFHMISERSARLLNLADYGLAPGNPADIVIIDAETPEQAVAEIRPPIAVFKRGRRTVTWHPPELNRPD